MSERGVFAVDRAIWEHDYLVDSAPFSRREAWLWLVSEAAWKPHRRRIAGKTYELSRGQLAASMRFIASKWHWSEARVRRFLNGLKNEGMIDANTDAGLTVLTICKYDSYQRVSLPDEAKTEQSSDAGATQERRKVEGKEDKEIDCCVEIDGFPADAFERFYERYPHKVGKAAAARAFAAVQKQRRATFNALMIGLVTYVDTKPPDRPWCNPATWLNQDRWADKPAFPQERRIFGGQNGAGNRGNQQNDYQRALGRLKERSRGDSNTGTLSEVGEGPIIEGDFAVVGPVAQPEAERS